MEIDRVKKIIVRMPNWVGDLVMATPILELLRKAFPKAEITAMALSPICQLLEKDPSINELFCFTRHKGFIRRIHERSIIEKLCRGKYDLGILLTNSFSSAWWFWQGKVPVRMGFKAHLRSLLLTDPVSFPKDKEQTHLVHVYQELLKGLKIAPSETVPKLYLDKEEESQAWDFLQRYGVDQDKILIGINPGAAYGSAKCYPPERFHALAQRLLDENERHVILFFGNLGQAEMIKGICKGLPERAINLSGCTSIRELMSLIKLCELFLTNDSGPMHIADALGTELIALFGSTNPKKTGPYRQMNIIQKDVECSPCYRRTCPIDFRCMTRIEVDEVFDAAMQILRK